MAWVLAPPHVLYALTGPPKPAHLVENLVERETPKVSAERLLSARDRIGAPTVKDDQCAGAGMPLLCVGDGLLDRVHEDDEGQAGLIVPPAVVRVLQSAWSQCRRSSVCHNPDDSELGETCLLV